jgi:hypothetical protein
LGNLRIESARNIPTAFEDDRTICSSVIPLLDADPSSLLHVLINPFCLSEQIWDMPFIRFNKSAE